MSEQQNKAQTGLHDEDSIYILDEFNFSLNEKVIIPLKKLIATKKQQKDAKINVFINSNGGYVNILWSLVDLLDLAKSSGITVRTIVSGRAYSCGSMLAVCGTAGERYISENAEHLMHYGQAWGSVKTPVQVERQSSYWKRHFERLVVHYLKHTTMTRKQIEKNIEDDLFFIPAKDCILFGLADKPLQDFKL